MEGFLLKKYTAILMMVVMMGLTGCASSSITLTDSENAMVAEYVAGVMLKYDKNYTKELIYAAPNPTTQPQATVEPVMEPQKSDDSAQGNGVTPDPNATTVPEEENIVELASLYSENINVTYERYELLDSYPQKSKAEEFTIESNQGSKLLVVEFKIENKNDQKTELQLSKSDLKYQLDINNDKTYYAQITPLLDDIQYFDGTIGANKSKKAVLVFEIDEQLQLNQINLNVVNKDVKAVIVLK